MYSKIQNSSNSDVSYSDGTTQKQCIRTVFYGNFTGSTVYEAMTQIGKTFQDQSNNNEVLSTYPAWNDESSGFEFIVTRSDGNCKFQFFVILNNIVIIFTIHRGHW